MDELNFFKQFKRSLLTFVGISLGPILALIIMIGLFVYGELEGIKNTYGLDEQEIQSPYTIFDKVLLLNSYTKIDYAELQDQARRNPKILTNDEYLDKQNEKLKEKYSFIAVIVNGKFRYFGRPDMYNEVSQELLIENNNVSGEDAHYSGRENNQFLLKKLRVDFPDGTIGSVCIVTDLRVHLPHISIFTFGLILMVIVISILVIIAIIGYAYYNILLPIQGLRIAAINIRSGDLDHAIESKGENGFADLYEEFDNMRVALKESFEERNKADALTKEVIGNISHDLKTPLTAIKGYAEGIMDGVASTPERMDRYVKTIHSKAADMAVLVDELSFFTKMYQNAEKFNFSQITVARYFADCITGLALDLETREIQLLYQCYVNEDSVLRLDYDKIKRVITNIVGNAIKYMEHGQGIILVKITEDEEQVTVMIRDNGKGIGEQELPHIFDRFYRTDSSRNSSTGGSGLGLAIAKKIIDEHNGKIWAESVLGKGTAVYFSLPKTNISDNNIMNG